MQDFFDDVPCGFIVFNDFGIITHVNNTLASMLAYDKQELVGRNIDALLPVSGRIFYQTHFFPLLKLQNRVEEIFLSLLDKKGIEVPTLFNGKRNEHEHTMYNVCSVVVVRQRRQFEQQLIAARKAAEDALRDNEQLQLLTFELEEHKAALERNVRMLAAAQEDLLQFSRIISHDVQEPVRKAALFSDLMKRTGQPLHAESESAVAQIDHSTSRLQAMIISLQQYLSANVIYGEHVQQCNLNDIIDDAVRSLTRELGKPVRVSVAELAVVQGNKDQLGLLFYHLLKNAVQFGRADTTITIDGDIVQQNRYRHIKGKYQYIDAVRIRITDNGPGFPLEYRNYIFGLFKKIDPTTKGTGVGLAVCKRIVENHFGSITVETEENVGSTFITHIPVAFLGEK